MERRTRLNLWLLAGVAVAAWLVWLELSAPAPEATRPPLTALVPGAVQWLEIERSGDGQRLRLERTDGRWWLQHQATRLAADALRVGEILRLVAAPSEVSYPLADVDAAAVGLSPPRIVVTAAGAVLRVGAQEPLHYRRYVATGERLHLVTDTAYVHLAADWQDFVDPAPLAGLPELVAVDGPGWRLQRDAQGAWQGDPARPEAVAVAWRDLAARKVRAGVAPVADGTTLRLTFADGQVRALDAWRAEGLLWLAWHGAGVSYGVPLQHAAALGLE